MRNPDPKTLFTGINNVFVSAHPVNRRQLSGRDEDRAPSLHLLSLVIATGPKSHPQRDHLGGDSATEACSHSMATLNL
jgi:hypothetical protein